MKNIKALMLAVAAITLLTFNSCKKDNGDVPGASSNTISVKVDGKATLFNKEVVAASGAVSNSLFTSIQGKNADGGVISIVLNGAITAGKTFSNDAPNDDDKPLVMFTTKDEISFLNDDSSSNMVSVTITSVSGNKVKGTFKGGLTTVVFGNGTPETKSFTEGTFDVTLIKN